VPVRLDASPDVRVYRAPGTPPSPPARFPFDASDTRFGTFDLWVLQSFLRATGARIEITEVWDAATFDAVPSKVQPANLTEWNKLVGGPNANRPPFDHDPPDAADVLGNLRDEPDRRPGNKASCAAGDGNSVLYVVVHGRDPRPLSPARVAVAVLRAPFAGQADLTGTPPLPAGWAKKLTDDLAGAPAARGQWFGSSGWSYAASDPTQPFGRPPRPIDPREAHVVAFDLVLSQPAWPPGGWLLLAVVLADDDPLSATETDIATLVRTTRHVAARSVRRFA